MDTFEWIMGTTMVALIVILIGFLGWAVGTTNAQTQLREARVAQCEAVQGTPMVDKGSRVLCFNPQVVREVR